MEGENKQCKNCANNFTLEQDDFSFYEKVNVPPPTFCPDCRLQRRLVSKAERNFYKRECGLCKKKIISTYDTDSPFPVFCQKCWWSDGWDPYEYGQEFDFNRPFFEQFKELLSKVPMLNMQNDDGIASLNCEYAQDFAFSKNCYMTTAGWYCDNIMYSYYTCYDKDIMDSFMVNNCERCYECFESDRLFDSKYSYTCFDSMNLSFCYDMRNCQNCFMCTGLRGKNFHIRNQPYSREEYFKQLEKENLGSRQRNEELKKELYSKILEVPHRFAQLIKCTKSTGHFLMNSKLSRDSFWVYNLENCRYMVNIDGAKDYCDIVNTGKPSFCYESVTPDNSSNSLFTLFCWKCNYALYSDNCHSCNNIFGCIGLKHGKYSILNKKYSKEEYESLKEKIIDHMKKTGEWGEFFPSSTWSYAYNETQATDFFPLTKEEALKDGYKWKEEKERNYNITIPVGKLSDNIAEVKDDILSQVIECAHKGECNHKCATAFRVIERELQLYRKMNIPLPTLCPNCRFYERLKKRNPAKLWHRQCMCSQENHDHKGKCPNKFETSYSPDKSEIIYCESCYNKEVY